MANGTLTKADLAPLSKQQLIDLVLESQRERKQIWQHINDILRKITALEVGKIGWLIGIGALAVVIYHNEDRHNKAATERADTQVQIRGLEKDFERSQENDAHMLENQNRLFRNQEQILRSLQQGR